MSDSPRKQRALCAHCGKPQEGNFSIHRDGFGLGPVIPLCDVCGGDTPPTVEDIWARQAEKMRMS